MTKIEPPRPMVAAKCPQLLKTTQVLMARELRKRATTRVRSKNRTSLQ